MRGAIIVLAITAALTSVEPAESAATARLSGPVVAVRPRIMGGPLGPLVQDGCVVKVAALDGGETAEVLVPRELNRCPMIQPGRRVKIEADLVAWRCEGDLCWPELSLVAVKLEFR